MNILFKIYIFLLVYPLFIYTINNGLIQAEISYGELVDKITILQIKAERISDPVKLKNIGKELVILLEKFQHLVQKNSIVLELMKELKEVNEALWQVEDMIRVKEKIKDFGDEFIQLARSVYITNDQRCAIKKKIDVVLGSYLSEEKSYEPYS